METKESEKAHPTTRFLHPTTATNFLDSKGLTTHLYASLSCRVAYENNNIDARSLK